MEGSNSKIHDDADLNWNMRIWGRVREKVGGRDAPASTNIKVEIIKKGYM